VCLRVAYYATQQESACFCEKRSARRSRPEQVCVRCRVPLRPANQYHDRPQPRVKRKMAWFDVDETRPLDTSR